MSLHKMATGFEGKADIVSTNPAAGGVTVDADEIALWVGSTIGANLQQSVHAFVNDCLERLREIGTPTSNSGLYTTASASWITGVPRKKEIIVVVGATFSTPASNGVQLYIGDLFQPLPGTSVSTAVKRLLEARTEIHGKKAA